MRQKTETKKKKSILNLRVKTTPSKGNMCNYQSYAMALIYSSIQLQIVLSPSSRALAVIEWNSLLRILAEPIMSVIRLASTPFSFTLYLL